MYKQAARKKLRFSSSKGMLSVEQLWDLSLESIAVLVKKQHEVIKKASSSEDAELSFLESEAVDDAETLKFNILKDIYITKKKELDAAHNAAADKAYNEEIMEIIKRKQKAELENLSIEELQARLHK